VYAFVYAQLTMLKEEDLRGLPGDVKKNLRGLREVRLKGYDSSEEGGYQYDTEEINLAQGLLRLYNNFQFRDSNPVEGRRLIVPVDYAVKRGNTILRSQQLHELLDDDEKYTEGTRRLIDSINANKEAVKEIGGGSTNFMTSAYEKECGLGFDMGFRSTGGGSTLLETAYDSPVTISLIMSARKLLEGGYGITYETLRKAVIRRQF